MGFWLNTNDMILVVGGLSNPDSEWFNQLSANVWYSFFAFYNSRER